MTNKRTRQWLSIFMAVLTMFLAPPVPLETAWAAPESKSNSQEDFNLRETNFNDGWKFFLDKSESLEASAVNFNDSDWESIQIPHDFSITQEFSNKYEAESGFLPGGTGWYRKTVRFPKEYGGKTVVLNFDGVYNNAYIYVNGKKLGEHHYGYTSFSFDISNEIVCDGSTDNVIAVKAVNEFPSSRWYSGSGIYRDVTLTVTAPVHVALHGSYVTTPNLKEQQHSDVAVHVETTVQNDGSAPSAVTARSVVLDENGNVVSNAPKEDAVSVPANESLSLTQELVVSKPKLWDCDNPNLYRVKTEILSGGSVIDEYLTTFGFRYFHYSADSGFSLNGKNTKMKGVCMHHDQGALGAASYRDAVYRQVRLLKEMGCNAIRSSHNAPGKILLEACNELGMLVMDEVYDGWSYPKNGNTADFSKWFHQTLGQENQIMGGAADEKWVQFALESFINRDKNDPCVVMWSIGNELNFGPGSTTEEPYVTEYTENAKKMIAQIQAIDQTRPITCGDNNANFSQTADYRTKIDELLCESGGVAGLNYSPGRYTYNHNLKPDWPLVATETVSSINSRGVYYTKGEVAETGNYQNTAYDTHAVGWGQEARKAWLPIIENDFMSGTFVWTGFDYIGEPTNWNGTSPGSVSHDPDAIPNSSYFGILDTAGFPKDSFYFYTSQWREDKTTLHLVPGCWNKDDLLLDSDGFVQTDIYSNASRIELLLNGTVVGTAQRTSITTNAGYEYGMYKTVSLDPSKCRAENSDSSSDAMNMAAQFTVKYEEGTIQAKAYDSSGNLISDTIGVNSVTTNSDSGSVLQLTPEEESIQADGCSLSYIQADILDQDGAFASQANNLIRFTLSGNGEIVGVDNGNPSTIHKFQQKSVLTNSQTANINAFSGKALVIVKSTKAAGGFSLRAESAGMEAKTVTVNTIGEALGETYLKQYDLTTNYSILMRGNVQLQTSAAGIKSDNTPVTGLVTWNQIPEEYLNTPGDYEIEGTMSYDKKNIPVTAFLHVDPIIASVQNVSKATAPGIVPILPKTVTGLLPDGRPYGEFPASWNKIPASQLQKTGDIATVSGLSTLPDGKVLPVTATVRVARTTESAPKNIAPECSDLTQSCSPASDNLRSIIDGNSSLKYAASDSNNRWTNWDSALLTAPSVTFFWNTPQPVDRIHLYFYTDNSVLLPDGVNFSISPDGVNFTDLKEEDVTASETDTSEAGNNKTTYDFCNKPTAAALTISFRPSSASERPYVGLSECEIFNTGIAYQANSNAFLSGFTVNGKSVPGFSRDTCKKDGYVMDIDSRLSAAVIRPVSEDNASITWLPADIDGFRRFAVQSENGAASNIYALKLNSPEDEIVLQMKPEIKAAIAEAEAIRKGDYSESSWNAFQHALNALRTAQEFGTSAEIRAKISDLKTAIRNLKKPADEKNPYGQQESLPIAGKTYNAENGVYKVISSSASGCTVSFVKPEKKTNKSFTVPAKITIGKTLCKVVKIEKNAFKNNKKLSGVTIKASITSIGNSAFAGAFRLKKIVIKSKSLKTVGKNAFKGIHAKAVIKVPKARLKKYKKLLRKKGQKASVKITG